MRRGANYFECFAFACNFLIALAVFGLDDDDEAVVLPKSNWSSHCSFQPSPDCNKIMLKKIELAKNWLFPKKKFLEFTLKADLGRFFLGAIGFSWRFE
jgi:hypothetical protein